MSTTASRTAITKGFGLNLSSHKQAFIDEDSADDCLQVIGVGLPRCGTTSLKRALELLGFDPCHHMVDCIDYPTRSVIFTSLINGQYVNQPSTLSDPSRLETLKKVMKGYKATVDAPVCDLYRELSQIYPSTFTLPSPPLLRYVRLPSIVSYLLPFLEAKFILSTRDSPQAWWTSFSSTIATEITHRFRILTLPIPFIRKQCTLMHAVVHKWDTQGGGYGPEKYVQHLEEVKAWIPNERVLEFNVKEGWDPLCKFLEVKAPDEPFPHLNDTREIKAAFFAAQAMGLCVWIAGVGVLTLATWMAIAPPTFVRNFLSCFQ